MKHATARKRLIGLDKSRTGISGFDEITGGGLPKGRPTLVCGGPGCGKTLFGIEFLVHGIREFREPGVLMAFEETADELSRNVASFGFDLRRMVAAKQLIIDTVRVERTEIEESGVFDLEGLFIRLGHAIDTLHARRVVLDTIEALFVGLPNATIVRAELRRLFQWLKTKGVTVVITGERGNGTLTRHGIEEYVSDCVICLDDRVIDQICTRRLRIVKYRGTPHGTNEYPFLIGEDGLSVWPITSVRLDHATIQGRISSGISRLDAMLGGKGYYRGSSILISGTAGTGKTSIAASFVAACCRRGERCVYFAFEESPAQVTRNMRSIGIDLQPWVDRGLLRFLAVRPAHFGLEMHLAEMVRATALFEPRAIVVDPIGTLSPTANEPEVKSTLTRLIDWLKLKGITALLTNLSPGGTNLERTDAMVSSLVDTWIVLRDIESCGERNRVLHILKSRGMPHSNQIREFTLSDRGIELTDVYVGPSGVLTGSARLAQEAREHAERILRANDLAQQHDVVAHRRRAIQAQIAALEADLAATEAEYDHHVREQRQRAETEKSDRRAMARSRSADALPSSPARGRRTHDGNHP